MNIYLAFLNLKFSVNEQRPHQFFSIRMKYKRTIFFLHHSIVIIYIFVFNFCLLDLVQFIGFFYEHTFSF